MKILALFALAAVTLPDGPGKDTTAKICGTCHGLEVAVGRRESADGWNAIVLQMIKRGAKGTDDEFGEVVDYLAAHFPKSIPVNTASAQDLQNALGLTDKEAAAIVSYREEKGKFKSFEDLAKVPGLDAAKLESKKASLVF
jgi:competence protein ComEA